ncbi:Hypothetical predicted protein [Paramuricea clavata]|uniref:Uncharacterized protein n=1 Tax=Paramuricea clavata TaxID=317549 RepID=A0A6S7HVB2_PARCT|nr:Hypothetical predicted protein [Paramuricea clavata]
MSRGSRSEDGEYSFQISSPQKQQQPLFIPLKNVTETGKLFDIVSVKGKITKKGKTKVVGRNQLNLAETMLCDGSSIDENEIETTESNPAVKVTCMYNNKKIIVRKSNTEDSGKSSGFRPGDSTVMQLVFVVNKIYQALEIGNEVCAVFLDISKAFDKVWHKGLLAKLKSVGINGPLLQWFESYLTERYQSVTIEGKSSHWAHIEAKVPQGSVLGPLLFLIYINDIADVSSTGFLFADEVISPID